MLDGAYWRGDGKWRASNSGGLEEDLAKLDAPRSDSITSSA